ncbi:LAQU0S02e05248g1_1 [Lachancea quebecensis]|uniref:LAQU0S02e05248g1_1 n=1 Tax=Lachancea quebecensis TaxID=1654605 RepID=A0A0N7ML22_9SACH|nr:LAQU0S02e05248g1_1 [Lachancea quebecensis]
MSREELDPAVNLADEFKKRGYFDEAKNRILAKHIPGSAATTLEQFIKDRVASVVAGMVNEDESLVFKNRGSTTALIEGQLLKDGYEKLNTESIQIDAMLRRVLEDPSLKAEIKAKLKSSFEANKLQQSSE